jgi:hypothetical protein
VGVPDSSLVKVGDAVVQPKEYLDRYTYLKIFSPLNNELMRCGISNYGSGWDSRNGKSGAGKIIQSECQAFIRALRAAHHGNVNTPCGSKFFFDKKPLGLIKATEDFYPETFTHAFDGKGSPDEIADTLRLAVAIGRIGTGRDAAGQATARLTVQQYATDFLTLDCNGLVGNYYGGNPSASIEVYASASRRRTSITSVQPGDAVVTHCAQYRYEHVALVQSWAPMGSTAKVQLVEWGWYGGEEVHYNKDPKTYTITTGPERSFGIGWATKSNRNASVDSFRYVFARPGSDDPHGWS